MEKKNQRKLNIKKRIFIPIIFVVFFQLMTFFAILFFGGEFKHMQRYAYDTLAEKTINRRNYVEDEMNHKWSSIHDSAVLINKKIQSVIRDNNAEIKDIKNDKQLNSYIMQEITDDIIYMMRMNAVNDAFVILETGDLYQTSDDCPVKSAVYLRDIDTFTVADSKNSDILMKAGCSSIAGKKGLTLDSEWTSNLEMPVSDTESFDFYYRTIDTAAGNLSANLENLGHWTNFSRISKSMTGSMKYTLPLIADGTVYGVVGVGVTENNVLRFMPSNNLLNEIACYVLAVDENGDGIYDIAMHSGSSAYSKLVGNDTAIVSDGTVMGEISSFSQSSSYETIGSIQKLNLYNEKSPYYNENWAVISVADNVQVLKIYYAFLDTLIIASLISVAAGICFAVFASRQISNPITEIINTLNHKTNSLIKFSDTGITEIDRLTDAIEELQVNVEESASRVSDIIKLSGIDIGAFMYNRSSDDVFVSESIVEFFGFDDLPQGDVIMKMDEFSSRLKKLDTENTLFNYNSTSSLSANLTENFTSIVENNITKMLKVVGENGQIKWFRFNVVEDNKKILGVIQDVTKQTLETKKMEYERDYDIMTGLLNRRAYCQEVAKRFQRKTRLKIAAFIIFDIDNLKYVNDTYGHDFGDDYIKTAANILKKFKNYGGIVSRFSGDEFNVFLSGFNSKDEIRSIISSVREELSNSYCLLVDGSHFRLRVSGGVSWYPENSESYEQLMKYADFAMYKIKNSIKGSIAEFDIDVYSKDSILITGVEEMNRIIDECRVRYAFHSIINARTGKIYGYEALMRPQSDILRSPLEFIRIAKTGAKLYDVEKMTWTQALKSFKIQKNKGNIEESAKVFINSISNCIMSDEDIEKLESDYSDMLDKIVLEILEGEESNNNYAEKKKRLVRKWNAEIALDDFGTGYNSEYALITSKPNIIKLDRSIISGCDADESRQNIIQNIVGFARSRNVKVLAEGVETYQEMKMSIACGVDLLQGYYINRPVFEPEPPPEKTVREIIDINKEIYNKIMM